MTAANPVRAAVYARMSTDDQPDSIDRQRHSVARFAERQGIALAPDDWYVDEGIPGDEVERRPAFQRLIAACQAGKYNLIVVDALDRFSRLDPFAFGAVVLPLRETGVRILSVTEGQIDLTGDATGILLTCIRAAASSTEARKTSQRIGSAFFKRAAEARWLSTRPYGYSIGPDGRLTPEPREAEVVRWLFDRYRSADVFLSDLADELRRRGVPTRSRGNAPWHTSTL